ncbi:hypothetical protein AAMO2058_000524000 [Amorphochlora amoebiformis]
MAAADGIRVTLNVYDLLKVNQYFHCCGIGAYHTGIEIDGVEWAYGHSERGTGVYACAPGSHQHAIFREKIELGQLDISYQDIAETLQRLRPRFPGFRYHLLYYNCNHFTADFYHELTTEYPPPYLNRLAALARRFICCLPKSFQPRPGIDISPDEWKLQKKTCSQRVWNGFTSFFGVDTEDDDDNVEAKVEDVGRQSNEMLLVRSPPRLETPNPSHISRPWRKIPNQSTEGKAVEEEQELGTLGYKSEDHTYVEGEDADVDLESEDPLMVPMNSASNIN